jgi:hypothetical protein
MVAVVGRVRCMRAGHVGSIRKSFRARCRHVGSRVFYAGMQVARAQFAKISHFVKALLVVSHPSFHEQT